MIELMWGAFALVQVAGIAGITIQALRRLASVRLEHEVAGFPCIEITQEIDLGGGGFEFKNITTGDIVVKVAK